MSDQGVTYATFIEAELKLEYERRTTLDARGLAIVTTSSGVITLLLAVAVLFLGKDFELGPEAKWAVVGALALFLIAALFGLLANAARLYEVTHSDTLKEMTQAHWVDDEVDARNVCSYRNVVTLASLRDGNNDKSRQVSIAFWFQLAAITALAVALGLTVVDPPPEKCPAAPAAASVPTRAGGDCEAVQRPS